MPGPDITMLRMIIDDERIKFLGLRQQLMAKLAPFNPPAEAPDHLIAYAEELGSDAAIEKLATESQAFPGRCPACGTQGDHPLGALHHRLQPRPR